MRSASKLSRSASVGSMPESTILTVYAIPYASNAFLFLPHPSEVKGKIAIPPPPLPPLSELEEKDLPPELPQDYRHEEEEEGEEGEELPPQGYFDEEMDAPSYDEVYGNTNNYSTTGGKEDENRKKKKNVESAPNRGGIRGWWQRRRWQRSDHESPTDKFLKRIPKQTKHIRVLYPAQFSSGQVSEYLQADVNFLQAQRSNRLVGLTTMLPFCLLLDLITFLFVFTIADTIMIMNTSRKLNRGKVVEDLVAKGMLSFDESDALTDFYANLIEHAHKMPTDSMIEELCFRLDSAPLAKTIRKVRNARAREYGIKPAVFMDFTKTQPESNHRSLPRSFSSYAVLNENSVNNNRNQYR